MHSLELHHILVPYNLRQWFQFDIPSARTVSRGIESIIFFGPKIWELK